MRDSASAAGAAAGCVARGVAAGASAVSEIQAIAVPTATIERSVSWKNA
jgi:hypothetical protein